MSDDGGGDTGGGDTNDYSCDYSSNNDNNYTSDVQADNDYSGIGSTFSALESALDFTSAVESAKSAVDDRPSDDKADNDYSGIGSTFSALESAVTLVNNIESTRSAFENENDSSSTRLQIDDVSPAVNYIPSSSNYTRRNIYISNNQPTTYSPFRNKRMWYNSSTTGNSQNSNVSPGLVAVIVFIIIVLMFVAIMLAASRRRVSM